MPAPQLPPQLSSEEQLDEVLSRPSDPLVHAIRQLSSPLIVLGASGKMGPSLCLLAKRAAAAAQVSLRVVAVSRFSADGSRDWFESRGIHTVACDLLSRSEVEKLPGSENIVYLVGLKFGTSQNPALTWAVNTLVPAQVGERYPGARVVALSTGNIYPLVPVSSGGATEQTAPAPVGEYGRAALARERIFEYCSHQRQTRIVLVRLNYAVELRYGVLLDIAERVWSGAEVNVAMGHFNCIWQGDANDHILRLFSSATAPPAVYNLTGPGVLSVREIAARFGQLMQRAPQVVGEEAETALLSDPARVIAKLGSPAIPLDTVLEWIAHWVMSNAPTLGKPTHFEVRSGEF